MEQERRDYADPPPRWMWYMPSGEAALKAFVILMIAFATCSILAVLRRWM